MAEFKSTAEIKIGSNVLNSYRSITYNFTLAALPVNYLENSEAYRKGELNFVILKSGGKGNKSVSTEVLPIQRVTKESVTIREGGRILGQQTRNIYTSDTSGGALVQGFNQYSPGRFDMFIENLEIETLMTFSQQSNSTLPTSVKFEIIEPYSVNGFIEALQVAAVAAGYSTYVNASYLLKLEFWGIPDNDTTEFKDPIKIPNSERYIPIGLTNVEVEITEQGTRYRCTAVPYNERAFGQPSVVKKPIKMTGNTVKEILDNFIQEFNKQLIQSDNDSKSDSKLHDSYEIVFKERKNGVWVVSNEHEIAKSPLLNLYEDNALYKFANPSEVKSAYKPGQRPKTISPTSAVVNFQENSKAEDIITAVIRDSKYVRDILENLSQGSASKSYIDQYGFVDYFLVRVETRNKKEFDPNTKRPYQIFSYIVTPYKVHFSRIPTYGQVQIKEDELKRFATREYNYIYTGNNIDVLNFKLNFNTLYFEAIPSSIGDKSTPNTKDALTPSGDSKPQSNGTSKTVVNSSSVQPPPPIQTSPLNVQSTGGTAVPFQNSPYAQMARNMHEAIINSKASMITGEIEIAGDPFYLVTGGMGNYNPKESSDKFGVAGNDEVDFLKGEVNIVINFRNPIDISTLEEGGLMYFDPNRIPFSGVYMVTKSVSTFKNGEFRQRLEILRKPGQILKEEKTKIEIKPEQLFRTVPIDENRSSSGSTPLTESISQRVDSSSVPEYLNRGAPANQLTGGLGGNDPAFLVASYSPVNAQGSLASNSSIIGESLPTDFTSDIRMKVSGLAELDLENKLFSDTALINSISKILTSNSPSNQFLNSIANEVNNNKFVNSLVRYNAGSGIGEGKALSISPDNFINENITSITEKFGNSINELQTSNELVNDFVTDITSNSLNVVSSLGDRSDSLINNIGKTISSKLGSIADPAAIGARLGIDSSKLSGLSSNLQSKLNSQINNIVKSIPNGVNLKQSLESGVALNVIPPARFKNLPPTITKTIADSVSIQSLSKSLTSNIANSYNPNPIDANVVKDKLNSAITQFSKLTNTSNIVDRNVISSVTTKFNNSLKANPLEKLLNRK